MLCFNITVKVIVPIKITLKIHYNKVLHRIKQGKNRNRKLINKFDWNIGPWLFINNVFQEQHGIQKEDIRCNGGGGDIKMIDDNYGMV